MLEKALQIHLKLKILQINCLILHFQISIVLQLQTWFGFEKKDIKNGKVIKSKKSLRQKE